MSYYLRLGLPNDSLYLFQIYVYNFVVIIHLTHVRRYAYIVQTE